VRSARAPRDWREVGGDGSVKAQRDAELPLPRRLCCCKRRAQGRTRWTAWPSLSRAPSSAEVTISTPSGCAVTRRRGAKQHLGERRDAHAGEEDREIGERDYRAEDARQPAALIDSGDGQSRASRGGDRGGMRSNGRLDERRGTTAPNRGFGKSSAPPDGRSIHRQSRCEKGSKTARQMTGAAISSKWLERALGRRAQMLSTSSLEAIQARLIMRSRRHLRRDR